MKIISLLSVSAVLVVPAKSGSSSYKTKGQSVSVWASSCNECSCTTFNVDASTSLQREGGSSFESNYLNVGYSEYDFCTESYFFGSGSLPFSGFGSNIVKKNGPPIILPVTLNVCTFEDYYNPEPTVCKYLDGSVTVTPSSDYTSTSTCKGVDNYNYPYLKGTYRYKSSGKSATATASVSVSVDGVALMFNDFEVSANINDSKNSVVDKTVYFVDF